MEQMGSVEEGITLVVDIHVKRKLVRRVDNVQLDMSTDSGGDEPCSASAPVHFWATRKHNHVYGLLVIQHLGMNVATSSL